MASALFDKINSYAIEKAIEFDEAYTAQSTPIQTGSSGAVTFTYNGNPGGTQGDGPSNGAGRCWGQTWSTSSNLSSGAFTTTASFLSLFNDNDWSMGFWFRYNSTLSTTNWYRLLDATIPGGAFQIEISGSTNTNGGYTGSKVKVIMNGIDQVYSPSNIPLAPNKWFYVALRRVGSTGNNFFFYLNGTQVGNFSFLGTNAMTGFRLGSNATTSPSNNSWRLSTFYVAPSSVIDQAQITEIWNTGIQGYGKQIEDLSVQPRLRYRMDDTTSNTSIPNSGSQTSANLTPTNAITYTNYPNGKIKSSLDIGTWGGWNTAIATTYPLTNSISFWFKKASPPASQTQWMYLFYDSNARIDQTSHAGINTNGTIQFAPYLGGNQPALISTKNICDGSWHNVVITRNNTVAKMYIDGVLESSQTWNSSTILGTSNHSPFGLANSSWDEYNFWNTYELTQAEVTALYNSAAPAAVNINYPATPMYTLTPHAEFIDPVVSIFNQTNYPSEPLTASALMPEATWSAETVINNTYNSDALLADATFVEPTISINVNVDAFGFDSATAEMVLPITSTTSNINYAAGSMDATATQTLPIISTTSTVDYFASPATASALLSSNVFFGETVEDTAYNLIMREVSTTGSNINAHNGFAIGTTTENSTNIVARNALVFKPNSGFPTYNKVVKARIHPVHVTTSSGDQQPTNTFNVYVLTADPTSGTFTTAGYNAFTTNREFLYETRLGDDAQTNYRIDLTQALADSRAATYGIMVEHVWTNTNSSGTIYDRTEFVGTGLDNGKLLYVLSSDFVNKNVNADIMTATAEDVMPTFEAQKYVDIAIDPSTASADIVNPTTSTEQGNIYNSGTLDASADAVQPGFVADTIQVSGHFEADARMGLADPIITTNSNVVYPATVVTASALFHMPQFDIGENNSADHMNASALMVQPTVILNSSVPAMVTTASVLLVDPTITGQLLGTVYAQPMTATAFSPVPSNFDLLTDDPWFNRLYTQDAASVDKASFIMFIKQSELSGTGDLLTGSTISDVGYQSSNVATASISDNGALPTPTAFSGIFDAWNRKALRFRNIAYRWRNPIGGSAIANSIVDRGYTQEAMIKTTKANQILFVGQNGGTFEANPIGLKNGKLFIGSNSANFLQLTDSRLLAAYNAPLMQATKTNIADGQWHHILIQFGYDGRHQIWVDGELELQRYGYKTNYNSLIGYNSANDLLSSDFEISVFSTQIEQFLSERDVALNYQAAVKFTPILADAMVASTNMTQDHVAKGNRGRALMLYFWSTRGLGNNTYYAGAQGGLDISLQRNTSFDQGTGGYFDYDTSINASTWELLNQAPQQWYGWDIFPVDVQGQYISSVVKDSSYKNPRTAGYFTGSTPVYWEQADGFYDETTDNRRYIDLLKDIDNLEDYDMIFFRNYPDQGSELDSYAKFESVDPYFNLQERVLFEDFLKSLRAAVDTGISLLITNPQLAIDLNIVDRVEEVEDLTNVGNASNLSDPYAKQRLLETTGGSYQVNTDAGLAGTLFSYGDTYKNNKHKVIRSIEGLTDIPGWIWTEHIRYNNDGARDFGGNSRWWDRYEYKETGMSIGNEFLISTSSQKQDRYLGVPLSNVKAGKAVTTFGANTVNGTSITNNPYANYATSIVVEPGDNLAGTQCGGKIFVSFTDILQQHSNYNEPPREFAEVDMLTDEVINQAYADGAISLAQRNAYINDPDNLDRRLDNNDISQEQYNGLKYWTSNGDYIISTLQYLGTQQTQQASTSANTPVNFAEAPTTESARYFGDGGPWFQVKWAWAHPRTTIQTLTINNRGLYWLKNRIYLEGQVQRPVPFTANASMVNATVSVERENIVLVTAMLSNARMPSGQFPASENTPVLPFEASARFGQFVKVVRAEKATASALMGSNVSILTSSQDEVVLYLNHVDPILYVREDIVK